MRDREMLLVAGCGAWVRSLASFFIALAGCLPMAGLADPPALVSFTYDDAGRLVLGTLSDGKQVGYQYDAAGNWTPQDGDSGNPYRYTGRRYDPETSLYYYRARYYSPKLGRFLQTDPIGTQDDLNLYSYVGGDAVNASDPTGQVCFVLNESGDYCRRANLYGRIDQRLGDRTRFFAAASATVSLLANAEIPFIGRVAVSSETRDFLAHVSARLEALNRQSAHEIESGRLGGAGLDSRMVHAEQSAVQASLDELRSTNAAGYSAIIGDANNFMNPGYFSGMALKIYSTDTAYGRILDVVRKNLGRNIDFGNQSDREAIGNALINHIRKTGGCDVTGSRIKSC